MSGADFPPVGELVPQSGGMCLLRAVLAHDRGRTVCRVDPADSALLAAPDGRLPVHVGLEYMAQCVAVHGGLVARTRGETPLPGLFLGARRVRFGAQELPAGPLEVEARHHRGERGMVSFDCCVRAPADGASLVEGRVNVYIVESWEDLREERSDGS